MIRNNSFATKSYFLACFSHLVVDSAVNISLILAASLGLVCKHISIFNSDGFD